MRGLLKQYIMTTEITKHHHVVFEDIKNIKDVTKGKKYFIVEEDVNMRLIRNDKKLRLWVPIDSCIRVI